MESATLSSINLPAEVMTAIETSITKIGYTAIGIIGVYISGSYSANLSLVRFRLSGSTLQIGIRNNTSTTITSERYNVTAYILWKKTL